jgi:ribonuclease BN (tRNA processing enzyme)
VKVTLLGSGGWIPTVRRETCCALVRDGSSAVMIDAGSGVSRLLERPDLLDGVEQLEIVLTHFHLDHVVGFAFLPALEPAKRVWAPGAWLYGEASEQLLRRLLDPPLFALDLGDIVAGVGEIGEEGLELGSLSLAVRAQELHPHPTLALRAGDSFAYCTDTAFDPGNAEFASGVRVLFHEAWHSTDATEDQTHTAAGEAGRLAADAGAEELVLIHVNPLLGSDDELLAPALAAFPATVVGQDFLERPTRP